MQREGRVCAIMRTKQSGQPVHLSGWALFALLFGRAQECLYTSQWFKGRRGEETPVGRGDALFARVL